MHVVEEIGISQYIRGFSTNVANYQPLGLSNVCPAAAFATTSVEDKEGGWLGGLSHWCSEGKSPSQPGGYSASRRACCAYDPCKLITKGNGGTTELSFAHTLQRHFLARMRWLPRFIIDTGRNGAAAEQRKACSSWCNIRGAGAGHAPSMNTGLSDVVDAFWWVKTPGESDGCTHLLPSGGRCPRFDEGCEGEDSIGARAYEPRAPEAGAWFAFQARQLARNADLRLDAEGAMDSTWGMANRPNRPPPPHPPPPKPPPPVRSPPSPPPPPQLRPAAAARLQAKLDAKAAAQHAAASGHSASSSSTSAASSSSSALSMYDRVADEDDDALVSMERGGKDGGEGAAAPLTSPDSSPTIEAPAVAAVPPLFTFLQNAGLVLLLLSLLGVLIPRVAPGLIASLGEEGPPRSAVDAACLPMAVSSRVTSLLSSAASALQKAASSLQSQSMRSPGGGSLSSSSSSRQATRGEKSTNAARKGRPVAGGKRGAGAEETVGLMSAAEEERASAGGTEGKAGGGDDEVAQHACCNSPRYGGGAGDTGNKLQQPPARSQTREDRVHQPEQPEEQEVVVSAKRKAVSSGGGGARGGGAAPLVSAARIDRLSMD